MTEMIIKIIFFLSGLVIGISVICMWNAKNDNSWKANYYSELAAHNNAEAELTEAIKHNQQLADSLAQWKSRYAQSMRENADAKTEIERLSHANKEMCKFLSTNIPDDLWAILFPKTDKPAYCPN